MIGDFGVNEGRAFCAANPNRTTGNMIEATLGGTPSEGVILRSQIADREEWVLRYRLGDGDIRYGPGFGDGAEAMIFTTSNTGYTMGRSAPQPYVAVFNRFALGVGINARQHTARDAAPTAGEWARGDVVWNINPTAAGWAGWICVRAGTPGTWKRFGAIEA
jgi:hypothetical protein